MGIYSSPQLVPVTPCFLVPRSGQSLPWASWGALVATVAEWVPILVSWGNDSFLGSFRKLGAMSPSTLQAGTSQLALAHFILLPGPWGRGGQQREAWSLPEQESGMPVYI